MRRVLRGEHGTPLSPDHVLDEGLTLLQRRSGRPEDARAFASLLVDVEEVEGDPVVEFLRVPKPVLDAAQDLFFERFEQRLSFTDCVVACLAREVDGPVGALDDDFAGVVPSVTA
jgi:predicted nucleic acid-binding protein